jgi:hypothetical protein
MAQDHVRRREFIKLVEDLVAVQISVQSRTAIERTQQLNHLVPDLTNFKHSSPCHI